MKRAFLAAVLSAAAFAAVAQTSTVQTTYVFTAVDSVKMDYQYVWVTGVQEGATTTSLAAVNCNLSSASSFDCTTHLQNCQRLALLAMTKPGQWLFVIERGYPGASFASCELRRVAP
jgi:hypothetical protein